MKLKNLLKTYFFLMLLNFQSYLSLSYSRSKLPFPSIFPKILISDSSLLPFPSREYILFSSKMEKHTHARKLNHTQKKNFLLQTKKALLFFSRKFLESRLEEKLFFFLFQFFSFSLYSLCYSHITQWNICFFVFLFHQIEPFIIVSPCNYLKFRKTLPHNYLTKTPN